MTSPIPKARACKTIDDISVGETFVKEYTVTDEMVKKFSEISGDWNPAHHNEEYAAKTRFKKRIAHGTISVAQFSGIFGMDFPGLGAIWMNQSISYKAPVYLDEPYKAKVEAIEKTKRSVVFKTWIENAEGKVVAEGQGELMPIPAKIKEETDLSDLME